MDEWNELKVNFSTLETLAKTYETKIDELSQLGKEVEKQLNHQNYRLRVLSTNHELKPLANELVARRKKLEKIKSKLPTEGSLYLKVILGNVNVAIQNSEDRYRYKSEYETFKLILSMISFVGAIINLLVGNRITEILHLFLLVWYHCTLTIRESILRANGSKIKGWWRVHHAVSLFASGVLIVWPDSESWDAFRTKFMVFNAYLSFVQYLQYKYQSGLLYRLKALGEKSNMDVTSFGFHSWMWRGLKFLLPFLFAGYFFELYLAYSLFQLREMEHTHLYVDFLALAMFVLACGNTLTTLKIIADKIKIRVKVQVD